jgi:uncharacterized protein
VASPADRARAVEPSLEAKVAFLCDERAYPQERSARVEAIETHVSWVFLTDRYAYKLKKPVRHEGIDFTTAELRRLDSLKEVRLNARLAPSVYIDVLPLTLAEGGLQIGGDGPAVDWLVRMRRLPRDRMLDRLIESGRVVEAEIRNVASYLAAFYRRAQSVAITGAEYRERFERGMAADLAELEDPGNGLPDGSVQRLIDAQRSLLKRHGDVFDQRVKVGRIVDGHGDLRPEHICVRDTPAIIDCLEFSAELRTVDPLDELAFLGLECERLGAREVGEWFLEVYSRETGDTPVPDLMTFYRRYRALRRAKLAIRHLHDDAIRDGDQWIERARRYAALAEATAS